MKKQLSAAAIQALKEALCKIYWYKSDLRSFIGQVLSDKTILSELDWNLYKRQIASDLVDILCNNQEKYLAELTKLIDEVCRITSFSHLDHLEDGKVKAESAKETVEHLRSLLTVHKDVADEEKAIEERRKLYQSKLDRCLAVQQKLDEIKKLYYELVTEANAKKRGFALEKVLREVFDLFDLDPKASFRNVGEQIDGAFTMDGTEYLFEAKWRKDPSAIADLDAFKGKIDRKLENTLGLFLSINGYSPNAINLHSQGKPCFICMTGADLMAVLEKRIDFQTLLTRKKRHAAQTGKILYEVHQMQ